MQIGEKLKELRQGKGMTQKELADLLVMSPQAISRWENNEVEPSIETLNKLTEIFDVSMDELFGKSPRVTENAPAETPSAASAPEYRPVLTLCEKCNKPIYETEDIMRRSSLGSEGESISHVYCRKCGLNEELNRSASNYKDVLSDRARGIGFGILAAAVVLIVGLIATFASNPYQWVCLPVSAVVAVLAFMMVFSIIVDESILGEVFSDVAGFGFHAPGVLFELDIDGIVFLIACKILFFFIGIIVSVGAIALAVVLGLLLAPFCFPYDLHAVNRKMREEKGKVDQVKNQLQNIKE